MIVIDEKESSLYNKKQKRRTEWKSYSRMQKVLH